MAMTSATGLLLIGLAVACSSNSFQGAEATKAGSAGTNNANSPGPEASGGNDAAGSQSGTGDDTNNTGAKPGSDLGTAKGPSNDNGTAGGTLPSNVDANGSLLACPPRTQSVLILDFKSGWWSGDGGDFVDRITAGLSLPCNGKMTLEYHHLVLAFTGAGKTTVGNTQLLLPTSPKLGPGPSDFASMFADPTWAKYDQIWVLSGSSADPEDLPINDPFFQQVMQYAKASRATFFLGVGYGSISHGAAMAKKLGIGASFATSQPEGDILDPMSGVKLVSSLSGSQLLSSNVLFSHGIKSIADDVNVAGVPAHGDAIIDQGGINIVANDHHQQISLAVTKGSGLRAVLDGDMPRYYADWGSQSPDTKQLLQNIMVYLSQ